MKRIPEYAYYQGGSGYFMFKCIDEFYSAVATDDYYYIRGQHLGCIETSVIKMPIFVVDGKFEHVKESLQE